MARLHVHSSSRSVYANPPDWPEMLVWRDKLRPGDLFVDVGANIGLYSIWAADLGADVIAVEPGEIAVNHLRENLNLNGYHAEVIHAALGSEPGVSTFTVGLGTRNRVATSSDGAQTMTVVTRTLDEILGDRTAAGVKVDVEGAEHSVVVGATRALTERRIGLLQLEWNDAAMKNFGADRAETQRLLSSFGYEPYRPDEQGRLCRAEHLDLGPDAFFAPTS